MRFRITPTLLKALATGDPEAVRAYGWTFRDTDPEQRELIDKVAAAMASWSDFEVKQGPHGIREGVTIMQKMCRTSHGVELPDQTALDMMRVVHIFEQALHVDPDEFFLQLLEKSLDPKAKRHV